MDTYKDIMEEYFNTKDIRKRNVLLKKLVFELPKGSENFFLKAYKKERYLDMRMLAIRGYSAYASEKEVEVLMQNMLKILIKRPESTPYNYEEYEILRSAFLMPYLIEKYHYQCFVEFSEQVEKQYNDMPDVFKNIFSYDEFGNFYSIRDAEEVKQSMREFFSNRRDKI